MLLGKKVKVGNRSDHEADDFLYYEGVIASEAYFCGEDECRILVLTEGKLVIADTYFMYGLTDARPNLTE